MRVSIFGHIHTLRLVVVIILIIFWSFSINNVCHCRISAIFIRSSCFGHVAASTQIFSQFHRNLSNKINANGLNFCPLFSAQKFLISNSLQLFCSGLRFSKLYYHSFLFFYFFIEKMPLQDFNLNSFYYFWFPPLSPCFWLVLMMRLDQGGNTFCLEDLYILTMSTICSIIFS